MHICLITGIFPPDIGGPATYVSRLADALQAQQHRVEVVTLGTRSPQDPAYVTRISRSYPLAVRLCLLFFTLLWHGRHSDVWYINGLEIPAVLAGTLLRKRLVMKIVGDYAWERAMNAGVTPDTIDDFQQTPQTWKVELHKKLRAWYVRQVECVITPSRYLQNIVCGWGVPKDRIRVIYNAVEPLDIQLQSKATLRQQLGISEQQYLLITVARLVPWKGIDRIIRALPELDDSVTLCIAGDGPQKQALTALAKRLHVAGRVHFLGKRSRQETLQYMRAADIFVLNTSYEGFSHVLLEAMMVGTPLITTPIGGNPELVVHGQNGILVEPGTLAKQLESLLKNQDLQQTLRDNGLNEVQSYSWERLLRQTLEVLERPNLKTPPA